MWWAVLVILVGGVRMVVIRSWCGSTSMLSGGSGSSNSSLSSGVWGSSNTSSCDDCCVVAVAVAAPTMKAMVVACAILPTVFLAHLTNHK